MPFATFIGKDDTVYTVNRLTGKLIMWNSNNGYSIVNLPAQLQNYSSIFVTRNREIYFMNGENTGQIDRWTINSANIIHVTQLTHYCQGFFIDTHDFLYCSSAKTHNVDRISLNRNPHESLIIAGTKTGAPGSAANELFEPIGIFVDTHMNLYVADSRNNRIQLFRSKQSNAITVAGQGIPMGLTLNLPTDIILDADDNLYIADNDNHRIIQITNNQYRCIIGCIDQGGSTTDQLFKPFAIHFDSTGALYIIDEYNDRIQKFNLAQTPSGIYLINNLSLIVIEFSLFLDCRPLPTIEIYPSSSYLKFMRNQNIYISSAITYNCTFSVLPSSVWKIFKSSNQTFETSENDLFIPARTLSYGIYKVELTLVTPDDLAIPAFVTYIEICQSNIFIHFFPFQAATITHHYTEDLILNPGEYSFQINEISFHKEVN